MEGPPSRSALGADLVARSHHGAGRLPDHARTPRGLDAGGQAARGGGRGGGQGTQSRRLPPAARSNRRAGARGFRGAGSRRQAEPRALDPRGLREGAHGGSQRAGAPVRGQLARTNETTGGAGPPAARGVCAQDEHLADDRARRQSFAGRAPRSDRRRSGDSGEDRGERAADSPAI